ncbi:MAG: hypothetical protein IJ207_00040 [Treponema sp.]|uniref:hypothetical protein n=1 Tax=Treponema sp. TaxID=166 RepID=UPI0025DD9A69|nr:hypothetical protein [Treponema sp.]MBQ9280576.1 hypothetical protein [Treponema sp.]
MKKIVNGLFTELDGETFYKIENYDCMEDFFMTITSSSDIWNFCWSQGGITAGRVNSDFALFPYYTADKVSDAKVNTGHYAAIAIKTANGNCEIWEPFAPLLCNTALRFKQEEHITRNIYKNASGTKVWFEEVNTKLGLAFRYGWTSSAQFGLVRLAHIENLSDKPLQLSVLDGCRNIMPACTDANFQNNNSVLLDAYKKTDLDKSANIALFSLSSVVTDKAEPSEGLLANVSWFTTEEPVLLSPTAPQEFFEAQGDISKLVPAEVIKGERPSCFVARSLTLVPKSSQCWEQVFDTSLSASRIAVLKTVIADRSEARDKLIDDIEAGEKLMKQYLNETDGIQRTAEQMTSVHHQANVMFNIMRGGFFADNGKINAPDLLSFIKSRNAAKYEEAKQALGENADKNSLTKIFITEQFKATKDPQLIRLALEYMPIIFSRRHGDPSRPWNRFNIRLLDENKNPILNYEGNWRDIFQNWEALAMSYPSYIPNMTAKFLNAMTVDGFNPYRISRAGVDWECPEPENPWAQYGYWGDHQVIYLQKFLELWNKTDSESFKKSLNDCLYTSANIPYRLKSYKEILESPHSSITFDKALSDTLINNSKSYGSDAKLVMDGKQPALVSFTAKLLQIVIAKTANLVPGGGIWMNTQRPEWNDANNALAGWGLSVVTLCYLHRMLSFLIDIYSKTEIKSFSLPKALYDCFTALTELYKTTEFKKAIDDDAERKAFTDKAGIIFETERNELYKNGYSAGKVEIQATEIVSSLKAMLAMVMDSIRANKRADGLYHTYNTMIASDSGMKIVRLQEMLEGQVAILSAGLLDSAETLEVLDALKKSPLFESRQESYILYPNKNLSAFTEKNNIPGAKVADLAPLIQRTGNAILEKDCKGFYHFNAEFHNARIMESEVKNLPESVRPNEVELKALHVLYEETFNHQNFTGRSGTFYAYEGLGSIYWHMVSKLLLAVQEHTLEAYENGDKNALALKKAYYDVRRGLSFNKTPELYGAFPSDPYSHTPSGKGAKQPGMTGQVKEEVLTRWGELGIGITNGKAHFEPQILNESEFFSSGKDQGKLFFTWCAVPITYIRAKAASIKIGLADGSFTEHIGNELTESETRLLFARDGGINSITVNVLV